MPVDAESKPKAMRERTKQFSYRIFRLYSSLPKTTEAQVPGKQVFRCGTSVAANYRAVCRARSKAEFISKMGTVLEEADETVYWLEFLADNEIVSKKKLDGLLAEARELTAIFTTSRHTAREE